jgi:isocitrate/isopropylmalate dehydrogenase
VQVYLASPLTVAASALYGRIVAPDFPLSRDRAETMTKVYDIATLPGDGIGEEVVREGLKVLTAAEEIFGFQTKREEMPYGADHFLKTGETMPDAAFDRVRDMHAVLLGAIGDPRIEVGKLEFAIIAGLRFKLDLYVNLRPIKLYDPRFCRSRTRASRTWTC